MKCVWFELQTEFVEACTI